MNIGRNSALIIIDVQKGWDFPVWGKRNNPDAEKKLAELIDHWRKTGLLIAYCKHDSLNPHSPLYPGQIGNEIKEEVKPQDGEKIFRKHVNSCFIGTGLEEWLRNNDIREIYICGITTEHCVSTTARMAGNLGFKNYVIGDATVSFEKRDSSGNYFDADTVHKVNLASIDGEFSTITTVEEIISSLNQFQD